MSERKVAPWMVAAAILAALVVAGLLVGLSQLGGQGGGGEDVESLSGVPQAGDRLGREDAPVEIRLYEDQQCPACAQFTRESLPKVVEDHVAGGDVRLVSKTLAFLGPDSVPAALATLAAGEQNLHWQYSTLFFLNQGQENSGYVTDEFLTGIAEQTPGLDVGRWEESRNSQELKSELQKIQDKAADRGIEGTPTLAVSGPNGERELVGAVPAQDVTEAIREVR
jgi:protein-disulfide isomerase